MLDDYIEVQNIAYKIFKNAVVKNLANYNL